MSLEHDIETMLGSIGLSLYDTSLHSEFGETIYRISVTCKEGAGVSMDKVVEATKLISPMLDVTPPLSGEYRLEVSSPGIERKLTTLSHFAKSIGEKVQVSLKDKTKLQGLLISVEGERISIEDEAAGVLTIDFDQISKAKTYFEW
ncbi:MAG: ribosome maturation factor RimP [Campylobacterales bacterium]|nr:ribosome maturation factor RimP [Campylobacterales bacterium]